MINHTIQPKNVKRFRFRWQNTITLKNLDPPIWLNKFSGEAIKGNDFSVTRCYSVGGILCWLPNIIKL